MEQEQPNYYAIIPAEVRYNENLAPNEKLLYGEITALCNKTGQCFATNNYFAELYNVEIETISRWIKHLINNGFITSYVDKENGNARYIQLNQYLLTNLSIPIDKKINSPIDKKINNNNTSNNNTNNNTSNIKENKKENQQDTINSYNFSQSINEIINDWLIYKKEKGQTYKSIGLTKMLNSIVKGIKEFGEQAVIDSINKAMESNYAGFFIKGKTYQKPQQNGYISGMTMPRANESEEEMEFKRRVLSGRNKF